MYDSPLPLCSGSVLLHLADNGRAFTNGKLSECGDGAFLLCTHCIQAINLCSVPPLLCYLTSPSKVAISCMQHKVAIGSTLWVGTTPYNCLPQLDVTMKWQNNEATLRKLRGLNAACTEKRCCHPALLKSLG